MEDKPILTAFREKKNKREETIYNEYRAELAKPNAMKMGIMMSLAEKYEIATYSTFYRIIKRVEERKANQTQS